MRVKFAAYLLAASSALLLCSCAAIVNFGSSDLERLNDATPAGTPFQQAQFKDYSYLARSFGEAPSGDTDTLANAYAAKALAAADGDDVLPEEPAGSDESAMHSRLARALRAGRAKAPDDAARAQADYDCWIMNERTAGQAPSARQCRSSLEDTLAQLEGDLGIY
jgi:OOP family OmpA-OmpF porin